MDKTLSEELKDVQGVTIGDVAEAIAKLSDEDKSLAIYETVRTDNFDDVKGWSVHWLDYLEANNLVNDYRKGHSRLEPVLGMMLISTQLLKGAFETQARVEMQVQDEDTQFGMKIAEAIADRAITLQEMTNEMINLTTHYQSVLAGRRLGMHYQDDMGSTVPYAKNKSAEITEGKE